MKLPGGILTLFCRVVTLGFIVRVRALTALLIRFQIQLG